TQPPPSSVRRARDTSGERRRRSADDQDRLPSARRGEGAMYVRLSGDKVEEVKLRIYEPPRFFEAFLRGRSYTEVADITSRICGICPVAYQTSAWNAIEDLCGIDP